MLMNPSTEDIDIVSRLIGHCLQDPEKARKLFDDLIAHKAREVQLPEGKVHLSEEQAGEFVERYSAEVEPTLWESKRRKF
jgi:hypothetical protein